MLSKVQAEESPLSRFMAPENRQKNGNGAPVLQHVGEIVESSTTELIAEACQLHGAPSFGRFVRVESELPILAIVYNVFTHSIEPNRRPMAYGKTEEELRMEQPQIFELLRTEFQALVVGYQDGAEAVHILPPQPARIHSFVHLCEDAEVQHFTGNCDFLRSVINTAKIPTDELIVAVLRYAFKAHGHSRNYLVEMGKELSRLLRDDYDRLSSIIRRAAH